MRLTIRNWTVILAIHNTFSREVVQPVCGEGSVGAYAPPLRLIPFKPWQRAVRDAHNVRRGLDIKRRVHAGIAGAG